MFLSTHGAVRLPQSIGGLDLRRRYRAPLCRVSAPQLLCLWTTSPGAHALGTSFSSMQTSALPRYFARLRLNRSMTTVHALMEMGAGWRLRRLIWLLIAWLFWWHFVASLAWVLQTRSLRSLSHVHMQHIVCRSNVPFRRFLGDVQREII
jgi:hypothetical protein